VGTAGPMFIGTDDPIVSRKKILRREVDHVGAVLNPVANEREALRRQGIAPKDHTRTNRALIKDLEEKARQKAEEDAQAQAQPAWKLPEFTAVEPKVKLGQSIHTNPSHTSFLRARTGMTSSVATAGMNAHIAEQPRTPHVITKPPVPPRTEIAELERGERPNFIQENKLVAGVTAPRVVPPPSVPASAKDLNPEYGRVPAYLVDRKRMQEIEEAEARRREEEAAPEGLVLLPEEERLATLETLNKTKAETLAALHHMPIARVTAGTERRRAELEQQLRETENSIRLFSVPKVFIKRD